MVGKFPIHLQIFQILHIEYNEFFRFHFQSIASMKNGEPGPLAQKHAKVEKRLDSEKLKLKLNMEELNALERRRRPSIAIPKTVLVCLHLPFNVTNDYGNNIYIKRELLICHTNY